MAHSGGMIDVGALKHLRSFPQVAKEKQPICYYWK